MSSNRNTPLKKPAINRPMRGTSKQSRRAMSEGAWHHAANLHERFGDRRGGWQTVPATVPWKSSTIVKCSFQSVPASIFVAINSARR